MDEQRPLIIISATNLTEAGPLSVLKDCLAHASSRLAGRFRIVALVHDRKILGDVLGVDFLEFPLSKKSWFIRLFHEWVVFHRLSLDLRPFLWLSLHDLTPRVQAQRRAVYCHNPAMFYPLSLLEGLREPAFAVFNKLYPLAYRINIAKNDWVIVQQEWMRKEFLARYPIRRIIVAHPSVPAQDFSGASDAGSRGTKIFFFPAYPRFFKNFEVIGDAVRLLVSRGRVDFEARITLDGTENRYAKHLARKYADVTRLKFIGLQPRQRIYQLYQEADCLIFSSKLETWGLPLSEFKQFGKPILAADLPYAHETIGHYDKARFFDPDNAAELALRMEELMDNRLLFDRCEAGTPSPPFAKDWDELLDILTADPAEQEATAIMPGEHS
jgi:glycosyltransferase involved in cell wall biosynthesis